MTFEPVASQSATILQVWILKYQIPLLLCFIQDMSLAVSNQHMLLVWSSPKFELQLGKERQNQRHRCQRKAPPNQMLCLDAGIERASHSHVQSSAGLQPLFWRLRDADTHSEAAYHMMETEPTSSW